jgi:hypothetical protein
MDCELYELVALVDALRDRGAREREMAKRELSARLKGGARKVSGICDVSEWAIKLWLKAENLNKAKSANAQRFARAAGESIENFLVLPDE